MWFLKGLHIVAWPLLLYPLAERCDLPRRLPPLATRVCLWLLHGCIVAIASYTLTALFRPAFTEWVEKGVVATARYWSRGGDLYPPPDVLAHLGVYPYGPLLFQAIGTASFLLAYSNPALKAATALFAALVYLWMFRLLRRHGITTQISALSVELLAVSVGIMGVMTKADICLIALSALACGLVALRPCRMSTGVSLAVLGGMAVAIKIHGAFYIIPAAIDYLARRPAHRLRDAVIGGIVAACVAMAPFLVPRTSLDGYIRVHRMALQDGLLPGIFISNIAFLVICVFTVHRMTPHDLRDAAYRRLMRSLLASGAIVSIFAAKAEAGPHHLIPFLPYLCLPVARALAAQKSKPGYVVLLALFLVAFQPVTSVEKDIVLMVQHWHFWGSVI
jgi:hypothetical protein